LTLKKNLLKLNTDDIASIRKLCLAVWRLLDFIRCRI